MAIPQENCWHADPSIPLDVLSCFDPLGNAVHTALSFDLVGEDVLITGAGPIGCMAIPICKRAGGRHVVVTDVNPYRLNLARKMGADLALDVRSEKVSEAMQQYWTNFARKGDPNGSNLPNWPAFDVSTRPYLHFTNAGPVVKEGLRRPFCDVFIENVKRLRVR